MNMRGALLGCTLLLACSTRDPVLDATATTGGESTANTATLPTSTGQTTTIATTSGETTAGETTGTTGTDVCDLGTTGEPPACDLYSDAGCGVGERCIPFQVFPDCIGFCDYDVKCVPLFADPGALGDPCTASNDHDTCGLRLRCQAKVCQEMCGGCEAQPTCERPNSFCQPIQLPDAPVCYIPCDPLQPDCPDELPICALGLGFTCQHADTVVDELYAPCLFPDTECASGMACRDAAPCTDERCCLALCDLAAPSCPGPDEQCMDDFNDPELGIGVCRLP